MAHAVLVLLAWHPDLIVADATPTPRRWHPEVPKTAARRRRTCACARPMPPQRRRSRFDGASPSDWAGIVDSMQRLALSSRLSVRIIYGVDAVHGHNNMLGVIFFCVVSPTSGEGGVRVSIAQGRERIAAAASAFRGDILSAAAARQRRQTELLSHCKQFNNVISETTLPSLTGKVHGGRLNFAPSIGLPHAMATLLASHGELLSSSLRALVPDCSMILVAFEPRLWCGSMAVVPWLSGLAARVLS
ncbi:hypothetical protein ZWY2020_039793 [Hordeum vulgare]|nr:hypothetical protein ZWY2020_039793 [Hordeum vulgare]